MKLPELKEKLKSKYIVRVVAGVLTIALVGTGIGATAVFAEKNSTAVTAEADSTTGSSKDADDIADKLMDTTSMEKKSHLRTLQESQERSKSVLTTQIPHHIQRQ